MVGGSSAQFRVGTDPWNIVQLESDGRLPAVDGSQLLNLPIKEAIAAALLLIPSVPAVSSSSDNNFVPTYLAASETFTVPLNKQALAFVPMVLDGILVTDGTMVML